MAKPLASHQVRILVRPPNPLTTRAVNALTKAALAKTRWGVGAKHRSALLDERARGVAKHDVLIVVAVPDRIGSKRYAKRANELVQHLFDTGAFLRVEADIPIPVFDPDRSRSTSRATRAGIGFTANCKGTVAATPHNWALVEMRVPQALATLPVAAANGKGIVIGHPDSGYTDHPGLGASHLDLQHDRDVISGDDDARDPMKSNKASFWNPIPNPGHGTSTASVIVGTGDGTFVGVARAARLVPIRATESVVQVFDSDVAKAVRWARGAGCHIVSMSLGGKGLFGLQDAIQEAVDNGMIVMAAAGNQVRFVTAPASYDNCLAVAATMPGAVPWKGSSRGDAVDVSAPGGCVWIAAHDWDVKPPKPVFDQSEGTSYAVAHLAGVAALWLARHGRATLIARYGRANIQALFLYVLTQPGVCTTPPGWNSNDWGVGVVDAKALLDEPLPEPFELGGRRARASGATSQPIERMASHINASPLAVADWIDGLLGPGASNDQGLLHRFEGELTYHLAIDASFASGIAPRRASVSRRAAPTTMPDSAAASPQLQAMMARHAGG